MGARGGGQVLPADRGGREGRSVPQEGGPVDHARPRGRPGGPGRRADPAGEGGKPGQDGGGGGGAREGQEERGLRDELRQAAVSLGRGCGLVRSGDDDDDDDARSFFPAVVFGVLPGDRWTEKIGREGDVFSCARVDPCCPPAASRGIDCLAPFHLCSQHEGRRDEREARKIRRCAASPPIVLSPRPCRIAVAPAHSREYVLRTKDKEEERSAAAAAEAAAGATEEGAAAAGGEESGTAA